MAEPLHQCLQLHGNQRLVLDDQHVGGDLGCDLAAGQIDQLIEFGNIAVEDLRRFSGGKTFHRAEQECLARERRDRGRH